MKKIVSFIFGLVLLLGLVGCNAPQDPEQYTIDKEVEIKDTLTAEEADAEIEKVEEKAEEPKFVTITSVTTIGTSTTEIVAQVHYDKELDRPNAIISIKTANGESSIEKKIYIQNYWIYVSVGIVGVKTEIPSYSLGEYIDKLAGVNNDVTVASLIKEWSITEEDENFKIGFDSKGCLIVDYVTEKVKVRYVMDGNKPIYMYVENSEMKTETKFVYDEITLEYPENLGDGYVNIELFMLKSYLEN